MKIESIISLLGIAGGDSPRKSAMTYSIILTTHMCEKMTLSYIYHVGMVSVFRTKKTDFHKLERKDISDL
jgi:hypothetical protein